MDLGFSTIGIISAKGIWRYIYTALVISALFSILTPWLFDGIIVISMTQYYVETFRIERLYRNS
ncbi:hypothetical protein [Sulfolobus sp. E11-6]|uniref:hypothetical protein n=1 Tax=Sulfolobus sp. E11-6 TaxID=2663020 RepID=UPI001EEBDF74|nr:hypothetical protein [Sulfolobus sp. E11-6]